MMNWIGKNNSSILRANLRDVQCLKGFKLLVPEVINLQLLTEVNITSFYLI